MGDLPQATIDMLPLSAEPMFQWEKDTDIRVFAQTLYPDLPHLVLSCAPGMKRICGNRREHLQKCLWRCLAHPVQYLLY